MTKTGTKSILKQLVGVNLAVLVLGFVGFVLFLSYSSDTRAKSSMLSIKEKLQPELSARHDKWRAWQLLGMHDVVEKTLEEFQGAHPEARISIVPKTNDPLPDNVFLIPESAKEGDPVVRAEIFTSALFPQKQLVEFTTAAAALLASLFLATLVASAYLVRKHIQRPLSMLRRRIAQIDGQSSFSVSDIPAVGEIRELLDLIDTLHERTKQNEKLSAIGELAQQVAHDIRSPLSALNLATSSAAALPENQRRLIQSAIVRINDIANNLALKGPETRAMVVEPTKQRPQYLLSMLRETMDRKLAEFATSQITLNAMGFERVASAFLNVDASAFTTVLSNLINNAREALGTYGNITVSAKRIEDRVTITIMDDGKGIPAEALPRLTERGFSLGKVDGSGLGLYHASEHLKTWGGTLSIESTVGVGTYVTLTLPLVPAPAWFQDSLSLAAGTDVAIVDDDPSIHALWKYRLEATPNLAGKVNLHHFFTTEQFKAWMGKAGKRENTVFLVDQEFIGKAETGFDVVVDFQMGSRAFMVTNRSDDADFLGRCLEANIKVIPKCSAEFISLNQPN